MSETWTEWDVLNQEGESTHRRPWMLRSRKEAKQWAEMLLDGSHNPESAYTGIEKECREVVTVGPKEEPTNE